MKWDIQKKSKMADIHPILSTVILNVNGLNNPIKRQKFLDRVKKKHTHNPTICHL